MPRAAATAALACALTVAAALTACTTGSTGPARSPAGSTAVAESGSPAPRQSAPETVAAPTATRPVTGPATAPVSTRGSASTTPRDHVSVTPGWRPWTTAQSATHFTAIIKPSQDDLNRLSALSADATITEARAALTALLDDYRTMVGRLGRGNWPTTLITKINNLIDATQALRKLFAKLVTLPSVDAIRQRGTALLERMAGQQTAIGVVKQALGMPLN